MAARLAKEPKVVGCATDTHRSTTEDVDANSTPLDGQRETADHFIKSQAAQGWNVLPAPHNDGGFARGELEHLARELKLAAKTVYDMALAFEIWSQWRIKSVSSASIEAWMDAQPRGGRGVHHGR